MSKKVLSIIMAVAMTLEIFSIVPGANAESSEEASFGNSQNLKKVEVKDTEYVKGEVLVVTKKDVEEQAIEDITEENDGKVKEEINISKNEKINVVKINNEETAGEVADKLSKEEDVVMAQPNYIYSGEVKPIHIKKNANYTQAIKEQWYLDGDSGADVLKAFDKVGSNNISVAVIDTGAQLSHEDLEKNIDKNRSVKIDNGKVKKLSGKGYSSYHGTLVLGVIAAGFHNGFGIDGVAKDKGSAMVISAGDKKGNFTSKNIVAGIKYAIDKNARVINMSLASEKAIHDALILKQVKNAYNKNILCVMAAGNKGNKSITSPGDSIYGISVMSHGKSGRRSYFSNYGIDKDVSAPGEDIVSTYIYTNTNKRYAYADGTSFAAPIVSGIATLLLSKKPNLTPRELKNLIYTSGGGTYSSAFGFGKVNANTAMTNLDKGLTANPTSIQLNRSIVVTYENSVTGVEYAVLPGNTRIASATTVSSNPDVATANSAGEIFAKKAGTCTITFYAGSATATCKVTVKPKYTMKKKGKPYVYYGNWSGSDALSTPVYYGGNIGELLAYMDGYKIYLKKGEVLNLYMTVSKRFPLVHIYNPKKKFIKRFPVYYWKKGPSGFLVKGAYKAKKSGYHYIEAVKTEGPSGKYKLILITNKTRVKAYAKSKRGKLKIRWKRAGSAKTYKVYIYNSHKKLIKKVRVKRLSYRYKKVRRGRRYYYRVRPCIRVPGRYLYGGYSKWKKIKIK